jgi:hypothetical protein
MNVNMVMKADVTSGKPSSQQNDIHVSVLIDENS